LGNFNVIASRLADEAHHLIGLADDVAGRLGILRVGGKTNAGFYRQVQSCSTERCAAPVVTETLCPVMKNRDLLNFPFASNGALFMPLLEARKKMR
jgi:hypothetical protein